LNSCVREEIFFCTVDFDLYFTVDILLFNLHKLWPHCL
jgi:hypothetical protein